MANADLPLPAGGHAREVAALAEVEHTQISSSTVRLLMWSFLCTIVVVPLLEIAVARIRADASIALAWTHLAAVPGDVRTSLASADDWSVWRRTVTANHIVLAGLSEFERALENETFIGRTLRPPAQSLMTGVLGAGNERVYVGRDRWVFYRQDVDHITRPGFLDAAEIRRRIDATPAWSTTPQPDPRAAIVQLKRDLDARGITLILMPTPIKPAVHPERLAGRFETSAEVLKNPSYDTFVSELRAQGVLVFDPSTTLKATRAAGDPQYLATDTHWRPETMESIATSLGDFVIAHAELREVSSLEYRIERIEVNNLGDTVRMLDLPHNSTLFDSETVWVRRVLGHDGSPWRSSRAADVLLLGDSFSNIYSLESMGWGTSAGFAEQLSFALGRPLDRLVQNDDGAFATRAMLQRDPSRLAGKRVVIYQFAARELTDGDWKVLPIP